MFNNNLQVTSPEYQLLTIFESIRQFIHKKKSEFVWKSNLAVSDSIRQVYTEVLI